MRKTVKWKTKNYEFKTQRPWHNHLCFRSHAVPLSFFISSAFPLILAGSCLLCRFLDRAPAGPIFISLCFIVRSLDAVGFGAAMTSAFAMTAKIFPNNVATVLVRVDKLVRLACCLDIRITRKQNDRYRFKLLCISHKTTGSWLWCKKFPQHSNLGHYCFRVVWRFSQDSALSWDHHWEGGSTSLLVTKSLF